MIRIAVVEDEDPFAEELESYIRRFSREKGVEFSVTRFRDGDEIVHRYSGDFEMILMDIQMPFMDGMTAAEEIRRMDEEVVLVFITNRTDFAIRGYQVDALDYVLKPINYIAFEQKMQRALLRLQNRAAHHTVLNTRNGMLKLDTGKVYYVESQGHKITYYTVFGESEIRGKMQDVEEELSRYGFFRINKGCLVNLRFVDSVQDGCCVVQGERLPVSRNRKAPFMEALSEYLL